METKEDKLRNAILDPAADNIMTAYESVLYLTLIAYIYRSEKNIYGKYILPKRRDMKRVLKMSHNTIISLLNSLKEKQLLNVEQSDNRRYIVSIGKIVSDKLI